MLEQQRKHAQVAQPLERGVPLCVANDLKAVGNFHIAGISFHGERCRCLPTSAGSQGSPKQEAADLYLHDCPGIVVG